MGIFRVGGPRGWGGGSASGCWGILVKKVIFIKKGNTHVMPGHQEKIDVTIEIITRFCNPLRSRMPQTF